MARRKGKRQKRSAAARIPPLGLADQSQAPAVRSFRAVHRTRRTAGRQDSRLKRGSALVAWSGSR